MAEPQQPSPGTAPSALEALASPTSDAQVAQILAVQRTILAKLEQTRQLLEGGGGPLLPPASPGGAGPSPGASTGPSPHKAAAGDGAELADVVAELDHHTELLGRLKGDLDAIFRKIKAIRQKLAAKFPGAFDPEEGEAAAAAEELEELLAQQLAAQAQLDAPAAQQQQQQLAQDSAAAQQQGEQQQQQLGEQPSTGEQRRGEARSQGEMSEELGGQTAEG